MTADIIASEFLDHPSEVEKTICDNKLLSKVRNHPSEVPDLDYVLLPEDKEIVPLKSSKEKFCDLGLDDEERLASSDDSSSSNPSEADAADQEALTTTLFYEAKTMVAGFSVSAFIHCVSLLDDGGSTKVTTDCTARPNRIRADFATAGAMKSRDRQFCTTCTSEWPREILLRLNN